MDDAVRDLIGQIYEAATEPHLWSGVVREIKTTTGSSFGNLWLGGGDGSLHQLAFESDYMPEEWHVDILSRHGRDIMPYTSRQHLAPEGRAVLGTQLVSLEDYRKSDFYHLFSKKAGMLHMLGSIIVRSPDAIAPIGLFRPEEAEPFGEGDVRFLDALLPHFRRALAISDQLRGYQARVDLAEEALNALGSAILLVGRSKQVTFMNKAALDPFAGSGELAIRNGVLTARAADAAAALDLLLAEATGETGGRPRGGAITIGRHPLQVMATPVAGDRRPIFNENSAASAIVIIRDPNRETVPPEQILETAYGLTPGEARITRALLAGHSVGDIGEAACISQNTIRTHLKAIYAKLGVNSRSELIRLLSSLSQTNWNQT